MLETQCLQGLLPFLSTWEAGKSLEPGGLSVPPGALSSDRSPVESQAPSLRLTRHPLELLLLGDLVAARAQLSVGDAHLRVSRLVSLSFPVSSHVACLRVSPAVSL